MPLLDSEPQINTEPTTPSPDSYLESSSQTDPSTLSPPSLIPLESPLCPLHPCPHHTLNFKGLIELSTFLLICMIIIANLSPPHSSSSSTMHPIEHHLSYKNISPSHQSNALSLTLTLEPKHYEEAALHEHWHAAMAAK